MSGCGTSVNISTLNPSNFDKSTIGTINIQRIKKDTIGLKYELNKQINNLKFNNKKYFDVTQNADSNLVGEIVEKRVDYSYYYKYRKNYNRCIRYKESDKGKKKKCIRYHTYRTACIEKEYSLAVEFELYNNKTKNQIFNDIFSTYKTTYKCNSFNTHIFSSLRNFDDLKENVVNQFLQTIAPSYSTRKVKLLDEKDIVYTKTASKLLDESLKLIKEELYIDAKRLLQKLIVETNNHSYIAFYNLGVMNELLGEYQKAFKNYEKAKNVSVKGNNDIDVLKAYNKIKIIIQKDKITQKQIEE